MKDAPRILGIDVGGSTIKSAFVDTECGTLTSDRHVVDTPRDFAPSSIVEQLSLIVEAHPGCDALGVGFPSVVRDGVIESPPSAYEIEGWLGLDLSALLTTRFERPVVVSNDADCAGMAEIARLGEDDRPGVVLFFTLGTGIGSALFVDGRLVPNTELGKLYLSGRSEVAELSVASRIKTELGLSWEEWGDRLAEYLAHAERLFSPNRIILGGGISEDMDRFRARLRVDCPVMPARAGNDAGIIGAAMALAH